MMTLKIDGVELPLRSEDVALPGYDARKLHSIDEWRSGSEVVVEVVSTPTSDRVMRHAFDIQAAAGFNRRLHRASLMLDGAELFEGHAVLLATELRDGVRHYRLRIRSGGSDWADQVANTRLNESAVEVAMQMDLLDIERSWEGDKALRFLPIVRDTYPEPNVTGLWSEQRVLMPNDYHPFLSLRHILQAIASRAGYKICSRWLDGDLAGRVMISGAFKNRDGRLADQSMGFKAFRTHDSTATADSSGFVFASQPASSLNLGAIVDTTDPTAMDQEGNMMLGAYNNGGALQFVDGVPMFTPRHEVSVSFEYRVRYTTDYRIASSRYLAGFDRIYLGSGCNIELKLENPYVNQASALQPNVSYKLFIFDYDETCDYMLTNIGAVSGPISTIRNMGATTVATKLFVKLKSEPNYRLYMGDWAVYHGFVEQRGRRDVEFVVRTAYQSLGASPHALFDNISFSGAEPGQQLTLRAGCSVQTIFGGSVGYGDQITFADVANHDISQQQLLEAIAHMFNLCIYSHDSSRTIYIEPYDEFFHSEIVDWRSRQLAEGWSIVEGAPQNFQHFRLLYASNDGVVERRNVASDGRLGEWTRSFVSYGTKQGVDSRPNPLFLPTISLGEMVGSVPSAKILVVGDRDMPQSDYVDPRVVLYHGMAELPSDEHWVAFSSKQSYPYAAFHSSERGSTLCFEDRDGCQGLHRHYDSELTEAVERGSLRCKIRLEPVEYLSLFDLNLSTPNIRSLFRLATEGVSSLYTLYSIEEYDAKRGVATCLFRRTTRD